LNNWISRYDLTCASKFILSGCGMFIFAGWLIGSTIIPNLGDKYGKRKIFIMGHMI